MTKPLLKHLHERLYLRTPMWDITVYKCCFWYSGLKRVVRSTCTVWVSLAILTLKSPIDINVPNRSTLNLEKKNNSFVSRVTNLNNKNSKYKFPALNSFVSRVTNLNNKNSKYKFPALNSFVSRVTNLNNKNSKYKFPALNSFVSRVTNLNIKNS